MKQFQSTLPARGATAARDRFFEQLTEFQSTLPARGATSARNQRTPTGADFNPRSPHGERHSANNTSKGSTKISIHAPRTGSDA